MLISLSFKFYSLRVKSSNTLSDNTHIRYNTNSFYLSTNYGLTQPDKEILTLFISYQLVTWHTVGAHDRTSQYTLHTHTDAEANRWSNSRVWVFRHGTIEEKLVLLFPNSIQLVDLTTIINNNISIFLKQKFSLKLN